MRLALFLACGLAAAPAIQAQSPIMNYNGHYYRIIKPSVILPMQPQFFNTREYYYPSNITRGTYDNRGAVLRSPREDPRPSLFPSPIRLPNMRNPSLYDQMSPMNYYPWVRMYYWQVQ